MFLKIKIINRKIWDTQKNIEVVEKSDPLKEELKEELKRNNIKIFDCALKYLN